jgi:hypothetical protein
MKLLFDANLNHELVALLADAFPGSSHVRMLGRNIRAGGKSMLRNWWIVGVMGLALGHAAQGATRGS